MTNSLEDNVPKVELFNIGNIWSADSALNDPKKMLVNYKNKL